MRPQTPNEGVPFPTRATIEKNAENGGLRPDPEGEAQEPASRFRVVRAPGNRRLRQGEKRKSMLVHRSTAPTRDAGPYGQAGVGRGLPSEPKPSPSAVTPQELEAVTR